MTVHAEVDTLTASQVRREVGVTELALRDAHQSLMATRMAMEDMVPACADIDAAGLLERGVLGRGDLRLLHPLPQRGPLGAAADVPQAPAQHRACRCCCAGRTCSATATTRTSVVDRFVDKSAENGMDVFRVFDALNDVRNVERAIAAVRRTGKHAQGTICYTVSPLHTVEGYVEMAERADGARLRLPLHQGHGRPAQAAARLRHRQGDQGRAAAPDVRIHVHCHATTGVTLVSLMKAIEAGADVRRHRDQLAQPRARATTRPRAWSRCSTAPASHADLDMATAAHDQGPLRRQVRPRYAEFCPSITGVETEIFDSQIPGGMISNMESQLRQQGAGDRLKEVLARGAAGPRGRRLPAAGHARPARSSAPRPSSTC